MTNYESNNYLFSLTHAVRVILFYQHKMGRGTAVFLLVVGPVWGSYVYAHATVLSGFSLDSHKTISMETLRQKLSSIALTGPIRCLLYTYDAADE